MKKILVTGSNGLLGQKLTDLYLQKKNKQLIATGVGANRHPEKDGYIYTELDITDRESVYSIIMQYKPDCVINTAAMTNVDACETDHEGCDKLNTESVNYLVEACNTVNAHLIHLSTDFIFNGEKGPYSEKDKPEPLSYYGHSKLNAEKIIINTSLNWSIIRTVLVYGLVSDMSRSNIVLWAKNALDKGNPINVVDDQFRTPTLAEDLAIGCFLVENSQSEGIYNISGKDLMSIYELVERVSKYFNLSMEHVSKVKSNTLNQPAKRPPFTGFKLDKAINDLNYNPHSFEEGIKIIFDQIK